MQRICTMIGILRLDQNEVGASAVACALRDAGAAP
jgi:hypothetical protein